MKIRGREVTPFFISVIAAIAVTVTAIIFAVSCNGGKINFKASFYFVCYAVADNSVSAGSISTAVTNYGGAGYVIEYDNKFYVTVSCYYEKTDAYSVCESLKKRQLDCEVLEVITGDYRLETPSSSNSAQLYLNNLNVLYSLSTLAYECANAIDRGDYGQTQVLGVISNVENGPKSLLNSNPDNCFSPSVRALIGDCGAIKDGYIYSKDLRRLQIAIADAIINAKLY